MADRPERALMFEALMRERRSIRGFRPDPVPDDVLRRVFAAAQLAPSNCNVQPWHVEVVSGVAAERMKAALHAAASVDREAFPDIALTRPYAGVYRERQVEAAVALFAATGVERADRDARARSMSRNYRFFEAPHAAFIFIPDWAGYREAVDCGLYVQSLALALAANGLGSCIQGALSHYADIVREQLDVSEELRCLVGLSFGFEDPGHPANAVRTRRADITESVVFRDR